jgi:hypothetical protein
MGRAAAKWVLLFCVGLPAIFLAKTVSADAELRTGCQVYLASPEEGARILGQKDDFVQHLSAFDRAARLKTDGEIDQEQFLAFVRQNVLPWSAIERAKVESAIAAIRPALQELRVRFPREIVFIKTSGAGEGHAFYTRDTAIIMPETELTKADETALEKTIAHELFHILSRTSPALREPLYAAIRFKPCAEAQLPPPLRVRKITNPDAPRNDHGISLRVGDRNVLAIPVLLSRTAHYDREKGGEFFDYLELKFLIADARADTELVDLKAVSGFFEQVGKNTDYIIHPEEILADNFALLVLSRKDVPSPEIVDKIARILGQESH